MLSVDTNLLLYAYEASCPEHKAAYAFFSSLVNRDDVAISEFVLVERPPSKAGGVLSEEESDSAKFPREADSLTPRRDGRPSRRERGDKVARREPRTRLAGFNRGSRSPSEW